MKQFGSILMGWLVLISGGVGWAADGHYYRHDPRKIQGTENCAECHSTIAESWKQTEHYRTYFQMHRRREARGVAGRMGLKRIKSESLCLKCHYVSQSVGEELRVISGVACESCHGPARDWNKAHSNLEDPDRLDHARALGLISSADLYRLASTCYACHTTPEERLVNVGGHRAGSDFELVSWLQGEVRHSFTGTDRRQNPDASPERKRILYILGRGLDLEHGLRGLAKATSEGDYATGMIHRIDAARKHLRQVRQRVEVPEVNRVLETAQRMELKINHERALLEAAGQVSDSLKRFCAGADPAALAPIDDLIPGPENYMGKVFEPGE